jgi:acyl phosphate:glycerol-3-phosphate acyltransferase
LNNLQKGTNMSGLEIVSVLVVSYLLGAIPFGYIVVKLFAHKNILDHGTGNVGTMNTHRSTNSKLLTIMVLIGDLAKGVGAYFFTKLILGRNGLFEMGEFSTTYLLVLAGVLVVLGHNYSVFLKFKGGKGLATGAGFLLFLEPWLVIAWLIMWVLILIPWRLFVLGQIVATVLLPVVSWIWFPETVWITGFVAIPVFVKHAPRIKNILDGTEPKMYFKVREEK